MSNNSPVFGIVLNINNKPFPIGPVSTKDMRKNGLDLRWPAENDEKAKPFKLLGVKQISGAIAQLKKWTGGNEIEDPTPDLPPPLDKIADKLETVELDLVRIHIKVPPKSSLTFAADAAETVAKGTKFKLDANADVVAVLDEDVKPGTDASGFATITNAGKDLTVDGPMSPGEEFKFTSEDGKLTAQGRWGGILLYTFLLQIARGQEDDTAPVEDLVSLGGFGVRSVLLGATNEKAPGI